MTDEESEEETLSYDEREVPLSGLADRLDDSADESASGERPAVEGNSPPSADGEVPALESGEGGDGRDGEGIADPSSVTDLEPVSESDGRDRSGPLSDLVDGVGRRRHETTEFDDLFEREEVGGIDSDALWEQIERDEFDAEGLADREVRDISKRSYCHQCEYFTEPPEMGCTHEGTDILELSSLDTFRVADCPVVLEDEALENE